MHNFQIGWKIRSPEVTISQKSDLAPNLVYLDIGNSRSQRNLFRIVFSPAVYFKDSFASF